MTCELALERRTWAHAAPAAGTEVEVQCSAHGAARRATVTTAGVRWREPAPRVAPGQTVALYLGDEVVGSGVAA